MLADEKLARMQLTCPSCRTNHISSQSHSNGSNDVANESSESNDIGDLESYASDNIGDYEFNSPVTDEQRGSRDLRTEFLNEVVVHVMARLERESAAVGPAVD